MINGGFGEIHVNNMLATLNIPTITQKSLKNREREVGDHLNDMAEESSRRIHSLSRVIVPASLHLYLCQRLKIIFFIPRVNINFHG
jgi:hypothetical protein